MAKATRRNIGSIWKGQNGSSDYIQIRKDLKEPITLKAGDTLSLDSPASQKKSLTEAMKAGKLTPEFGEKMLARVAKIPEGVRFEIVQIIKESSEE